MATARGKAAPWAFGLVNCILYQAMYREGGGAVLDDATVRRYAAAMRAEPLSDRPMAEQAAALRAVLATGTPLASTFDPYEGQEPFGEAEFRGFLARLADELDSRGPRPPAAEHSLHGDQGGRGAHGDHGAHDAHGGLSGRLRRLLTRR
ncbi:hypothetical protein EF912_32690 [Streptomyces sp. WAC07061]|uniref:hypothetical protein n=1 Tax=Streptomyces sp. WAC07061 TaxID=2487410 RepID=UPI000F7A9CBF|nr:hypothetical protein [Streptomyces sp. WAC07061]RSS39942.1 hypothetical protein EF912_32690 [Streptomyces sp. WAC07061]